MNILYNIPTLQQAYGGIYQYSVALLQILRKSKSDFKIYIYCENPSIEIQQIIERTSHFYLCDITALTKNKERNYGYKVKALLGYFGLQIKPSKKQDVYDFLINKYQISVIHSPYQTSVIRENIKSITTIHDVQELHFPEFFSSEERASRAVNYKFAIDKSDAIVVSYNHVKDDIIRYFNKDHSKVHTILLDMGELWFDKIKHDSPKNLERFDLPDGFILYPAATWQHKNHLTLLKSLQQKNVQSINLVCTGNKTDYYDNVLYKYMVENELQDRVFFLGIVEDEELYSLYHKATAVVIPTLYEAGSFPLMESIIMNIPVICSNVTSLPETIGNNDFVFNPNDEQEMARKIDDICNNRSFRAANLEMIQKRKQFLLKNGALDRVLNLYANLGNTRSTSTKTIC